VEYRSANNRNLDTGGTSRKKEYRSSYGQLMQPADE
jgi:hypothetical protein